MLRSSLLKAADTTERTIDRFKTGLKWRYDLWSHLQIRPYRGFGTRSGPLRLRGRVLDDKNLPAPDPDLPTWRNAIRTLRRIESDELPGAHVRLHFGMQTLEAVTDEDGFFTFDFHPEADLSTERAWHKVRLELEAPAPEDPEETAATGHLLVPHEEAEFAVVSDLDDTVIRTGATNKIQMMRVVLLNNGHTRTPFPGVSAFYRALQQGSGTGEQDRPDRNPVFYVSSSPWNLYGMFEGFFKAYELPLGPLFLKDYGLTAERFFKTGHATHKTGRIERLLETYPDLPFVLVGDSGQHDPEIYRRLVGDHEGRIRAVFIRDVTTPERDAEVHAIARQVRRMGVPMVLARHSDEAAARAADLGLISGAAVDAVRQAMQQEEHEKEAPGGLRERLLG